MAIIKFPVAADAASTTLRGRVAELEGMVERLLAVQERTAEALARLAPPPAAAVPERPALRVVR
jgi:hypothetical protein